MGKGGMGSKKSKKEKKAKEKHKKKKAKKDVSSSSESDSDSDSAEVKRVRAAKMAKKLATRLKDNQIAGYTDQENPFGDANLTERFVWHKKIEKNLMDGVDVKELGLKAEKKRHKERLREIEKVKEAREKRDRERVEQEEEREIQQRELAMVEAVELEKKEEDFHLKQAQMRAEIRVKEGRAKPIDAISRNLHAEKPEEFDDNVHPLAIFDGLTLTEIVELKEDLRVYLDLDKQDEKHREFWQAMLVVAETEVKEAKRREDVDRARVRGVEPSREITDSSLHATIQNDVQEMLTGKGHAELEELEREIDWQVNGPEATEVEYWTAVLRRIQAAKARAQVAEINAGMKARHMAARAERGEDVIPPPPPKAPAANEEDEDLLGADFGRAAAAAAADGEDQSDKEEDEPLSPRATSPSAWDKLEEEEDGGDREGTPVDDDGSFSPDLREANEDDEFLEVVDEKKDAAELARKRAEVRMKDMTKFSEATGRRGRGRRTDHQSFAQFKNEHAMNQHVADHGVMGNVTARPGDVAQEQEEQERRARQVAQRMMGDDQGEVQYKGEVELESQVYWWHDKYRPRKPKYFNRVHTGYEWNKYNQTHYDHDNPPPKVVQGYKFNLFYPDLIDKSQAPTYTIMPDGSKHGETCILRIHAGPPYEDIAFKIVNKEWEYAQKKGFKCSFERGIFHLYINFQRARYRR